MSVVPAILPELRPGLQQLGSEGVHFIAIPAQSKLLRDQVNCE